RRTSRRRAGGSHRLGRRRALADADGGRLSSGASRLHHAVLLIRTLNGGGPVPRLRLTRTLSIRTRLLLYFVCVVVLTAGAISGMTAVIESREAHQRVVAQLRSVVTLKEQQITSWASGLRLSL